MTVFKPTYIVTGLIIKKAATMAAFFCFNLKAEAKCLTFFLARILWQDQQIFQFVIKSYRLPLMCSHHYKK